MEEFLLNMRNDHSDFENGSIEDQLKNVDPIQLFKKWLKEAIEFPCLEANAMIICTVDEENMPSSRTVYLKEIDEEGLVFFTNYNSKKGQDLKHNPKISVSFFWKENQRQIQVQGLAKKISVEASDTYFHSRPRGSQIGAWASKQSQTIDNREELEASVQHFEALFQGKEVPRPVHWGGYVIQPLSIEFWQGRPSRLHDRISFSRTTQDEKEWDVVRKNP